jgi:predicted glycoside hydrolase/deacetylase ChbG (UPF0249 family)
MAVRTFLIVNADDLGFSPGVTDGILLAHRQGILTSTTLMTTMPDRDRAIELAKSTPTLGVGIHLCLTQGVPLTACRRLCDRHSQFLRRVPRLALRLLTPVGRRQARAEWSAQIEYALSRGLTPTHLDSHKHVHHLPMLQEIVCELAEHYGIRYVRAAREIRIPYTTRPRGGDGYRILARLAERLSKRAQDHRLATSDWFFGLATTGLTDLAVWRKLLAHLPAGIGEVMVHPGYQAGLRSEGPQRTRLIAARELELAALCAPELVVRLGTAEAAGRVPGVSALALADPIVLRHYGNLPS